MSESECQQLANDNLSLAIRNNSPDEVKEAIFMGADVNSQSSQHTEEQLWLHANFFFTPQGNIEEQTTRRKEIEEILATHANVTAPSTLDRSCGEKAPAFNDVIIYGHKTTCLHGHAMILLKAIIESNGAARLDLPYIFKGIGDTPYDPIREKRKQHLIDAHAIIANELRSPTTDIGKKAKKSLSLGNNEENIKYWSDNEEFKRSFPNLADLPMPNRSISRNRYNPWPWNLVQRNDK